MTEKEIAYLYWLYCGPGIGHQRAQRLLDACGTAEGIFRQADRAVRLLEPSLRGPFLAHAETFDPMTEYRRMKERGIRFTCERMDDYPDKLKEIPDPPFGLTWKGELPDPKIPSVAVIGARQCSEYGRQMAARFGTELAQAGIQVISGMAVGIDGLAQSGALKAGGISFGILGSGVDVCYPAENRALYEKLINRGGVISENPPGTQPQAKHFPRRNRLISGFCDLLLVIEARKRSGTAITVDMALEQGRDVYALPGRVTDALSDGCNQLIRQGAGIATCVQDLIDVFRADAAGKRPDTADDRGPLPAFSGLTEQERLIADLLRDLPRSVSGIADALASKGHPMEIPVLSEILIGLCLKGIAESGGGCFRLTVNEVLSHA